ncbi:MAG: hypothetical protein Q8940_22490, partial [Bacteroidota bacterium]|nr:hypothetical protein [Bacteroidota bacterium]
MNTQSYYKEILKKFDKLTQKEYSSLSLTGIQLALMAAAVLFLVLSISELIGNFSSMVRTSMFFVFLVASFALVLYLFIYPLIRSFNLFGRDNYDSTAKKVGMLFPSIKDDLINAMQLIRIKDNKT